MLLQGIAWVDQTDFRIVRLRTDLLAPQPEIDYQKQTSNIAFGQVHVAALALALWLSQAVDAEMEASGQHLLAPVFQVPAIPVNKQNHSLAQLTVAAAWTGAVRRGTGQTLSGYRNLAITFKILLQ